MNRYRALFDHLQARKEGAFGAFVMLGDPDPETSAAILDGLVAAGADMIEVGIPFSDPIADGPVIQAAANRALAAGVRPVDTFGLIARFRRRHADIPVGILTYANLVLARGRDAFYRAAAEAGADSVLVADAPLIEAEPFAAAARAHGVAPVLIAAGNTPPDRLARIAALGGGYTYCVARPGVTGADETVHLNHGSLLATLERHGAPPPVFGFGIARPAHVEAAFATGAAGVICGSAIVRLIAAHAEDPVPAIQAFVESMVAAKRRPLATDPGRATLAADPPRPSLPARSEDAGFRARPARSP